MKQIKAGLLLALTSSLMLSCAFAQTDTAVDSRDSDSRHGILEFIHWDHDWNGHHYDEAKVTRAVQMMKEVGVGWIRMDFLWDDVQPAKDRWEFKKYDRLVDELEKDNIKILGMLDYNTVWAGEYWNSAPDIELYTRYARAVVARYKSRVKYWEIWNEPNESIYWIPQDGMKSYTALLISTAQAIRKEDPTAKIVLGGLTGDMLKALRQIYKHGGKDAFDVMAIHPFVDPLKPDALIEMKRRYEAVRSVMLENKDGEKSVWFTEIGCPGVPDFKETKDWWIGKNPDETQQSEWVQKVYDEPLKWEGVGKVFWAFFRDTPDHFLTGTDYFGLVREDFTPKPSLKAYRERAGVVKGRCLAGSSSAGHSQ